jgi:hypothetical protein
MALDTALQVALRAKHSSTLDLSNPEDLLLQNIAISLATGTSSNQADLVFHDKRTILTGANDDLDLAGSLTDGFGTVLTFVKVKVILIYNLNASRTLTIGGAATPFSAFMADPSDKIVIQPSGLLLLVAPNAGYTVGAGSTDLLRVANDSGSSCDYRIIIIGTSA